MNRKATFCIACLAIFYLLSSKLQKCLDTFLQKVEGGFNSGDPEVRTWFLVRHNYLPFIVCGCYAIFSWSIGPALMRNRKPFQLKKVMVVFNFSLVIVYTSALLAALYYLPTLPREFFCKGGIVKKGHVSYTLVRLGWVVYILKYIELLDTVFFILRKKENQITSLHVIHHTLVPFCGFIILRTEKGGIQGIPIILNSIVHVVMYSYYGLSAMGPRVKKYLWWKKYLTQLQIIQFCLILVFVTIVAPLTGCTMVLSSYVMDFAIAVLFLHLFYRFYMSSFHSKTKPAEIDRGIENNSFKNRAPENEIYTNGRIHASTNHLLVKQE